MLKLTVQYRKLGIIVDREDSYSRVKVEHLVKKLQCRLL
jgi:hypothetical protein